MEQSAKKYSCPVCATETSTQDEVCYYCGGTKEGMLKQFFSAYFHQDFLLDAVNPDDVIEEYKKENTIEHRTLLRKAILDYVEKITSDDELNKKLLSELGCYYRTEADGMSARSWLQKVAEQLLS